MKATVEIGKSFDDGAKFSKEYDVGDFVEFFKEEGAYLDRLTDTVKNRGADGEGFKVTYTVTIVK